MNARRQGALFTFIHQQQQQQQQQQRFLIVINWGRVAVTTRRQRANEKEQQKPMQVKFILRSSRSSLSAFVLSLFSSFFSCWWCKGVECPQRLCPMPFAFIYLGKKTGNRASYALLSPSFPPSFLPPPPRQREGKEGGNVVLSS